MTVIRKPQDAKARFGELVRRGRAEGPRSATVGGKRAVAIPNTETYERLAAPQPQTSSVDFMRSLDLEGLELARPYGGGWDIEL